jgi:hypothetical protein
MLIFKGFREGLSLGGQDAREEQILRNPPPKRWDARGKSATLHIIALAQYAPTYGRSWAADSSQRVGLKAECQRLEQEAPLLREETRIRDVRMAGSTTPTLKTASGSRRSPTTRQSSGSSRTMPISLLL